MHFHLRRSGLCATAAALLLALALLTPALARPSDSSQPSLSANELLRQAVSNEKAAQKDDYYAWMDRLQKPRGSVTKLMVNTPQGILARTIEFNDRALTADERRQDDERINRLLNSNQMREKANKQRDDQRHIERILLALPDAYRCEYSTATHEERTLRLECSPNPGFSPPNYESQVLPGMNVVILIDRDDRRITRLEGTLFKDVTFGWGFLGRLNRGGRIEIAQSKVAGRHWGITRMQLVFEGHIVVLKPLHIEETESAWDYRQVPEMTVAQALKYLRSAPARTNR